MLTLEAALRSFEAGRRDVDSLLPFVTLHLLPSRTRRFQILPRVTLDLRLAVLAALQLIMPCHISGFSVCWRLSSTAKPPRRCDEAKPGTK